MADSLRILITDEDLDSRVNTRKALQRAQLGVAGETGYGTEAVSLAVESRPDAILVAVEEPTGRALDTAEALSNALPDTPIIIYSSLEDAESLRRGMVFGARDYLVKPVQSMRLRAAITQALEQEERRQMRRAGQLVSVEARGTVITVTGAKGGIGKSVLAVNLAVALRSQTGKSVVVLDADTQFGDVATMLDLTPTVTVTNVIKHLDEMDRQNVREFVTPHASGIEVMAAPREEDSWGRIDQEGLKKIIDLLAQLYEFVIIDTSGSFDSFVRTCVEASTLAKQISSAPLSPKEAAPIFADVAAALQQAHSIGAIHGSLSAETILVSASKRASITDFGLVAGTLDGDLEALGSCLYQAVSGRAATSGSPPLMSALGAICARAMDKDPAKRYANARAMEADLRAYVAGTFQTAPVREEESGRRFPWEWTFAAIAAVACIAVAAVWRGSSARAGRVKELRAKLVLAELEARLSDMALLHDEIAWTDPSIAVEESRKSAAIRAQIEQEKARAPAAAALARAREAVVRAETAQREGTAGEALLRAPLGDFFAALGHPSMTGPARAELADYAMRQMIAAEREDRHPAAWRLLVEQFHDGRYAAELQAGGVVEVTTTPRGARVLIDGKELGGRTPATIGAHVLLARLDGYRDARVLVRVARSGTTNVSIRLFTEAQIGREYIQIPSSDALVGQPPHVRYVDDVFILRRPLPIRTWEQATSHADALTREAQARGERVTYRLPSAIEWEKAAQGGAVYGLEDIGEEWCEDSVDGSERTHAIRTVGVEGVSARAGDEGDVARFRLVRVVTP